MIPNAMEELVEIRIGRLMEADGEIAPMPYHELEKLLKDAIVKHCRFSYAHIKDVRHL